MCWHQELSLLLMVYVDDFKMAGPKAALAKGWTLIRQGLDVDDPALVDRCLGCHHSVCDGKVNGKSVRMMQFKVESFMRSCVQAYKDLCGEPDMKLRSVENTIYRLSREEDGGGCSRGVDRGRTRWCPPAHREPRANASSLWRKSGSLGPFKGGSTVGHESDEMV